MTITIRPVERSDVAAMAAIRAQEWQSQAFWTERIEWYLSGKLSPQLALPERAAFVAVDESGVVGFVAGHRTRRFNCDGELQWINVAETHRGKGIAGQLIRVIGAWFAEQKAKRVCVNVDPKNIAARKLYAQYGARTLHEHWMVWENLAGMIETSKSKLPTA